MSFAKAIEEF